MNVSELDKAVEYTKQFIEAATPIAKKAYEIGILTLRVDAIGTVLFAAAGLVICFFALRKILSDYRAAIEKTKLPENNRNYYSNAPGDHLPLLGIFHGILGMSAAIVSIICVVNLLQIWLWVKIFSPELWLAHRAIEKLVN